MRSRSLVVAGGVLLLTAGTAAANPPTSPSRPPRESARSLPTVHAPRARSLPTVHAPRGWLRAQVDRIHVNKTTGFAYTRRLDRREVDWLLSLRGPALEHKRLGLSLELQF